MDAQLGDAGWNSKTGKAFVTDIGCLTVLAPTMYCAIAMDGRWRWGEVKGATFVKSERF